MVCYAQPANSQLKWLPKSRKTGFSACRGAQNLRPGTPTASRFYYWLKQYKKQQKPVSRAEPTISANRFLAVQLPVAGAAVPAACELEFPKVLPKSAIGQAIAYARARWSTLCRYVEDGRIEIDNNLV